MFIEPKTSPKALVVLYGIRVVPNSRYGSAMKNRNTVHAAVRTAPRMENRNCIRMSLRVSVKPILGIEERSEP